jgi:hypothetical protein
MPRADYNDPATLELLLTSGRSRSGEASLTKERLPLLRDGDAGDSLSSQGKGQGTALAVY